MAANLTPVASDGALDDATVLRASGEDPELFAVLYDRYAEQLFQYAQRRLGPDAAQDVVAETFLAAFRHRARYDSGRPLARPWLFGILVKEIARHRRKERAYLKAVASAPRDVVDGPAERVGDEVLAWASRASVAAALLALSARERELLLLIAWSELSYEEAAEVLGLPIGTVRSRLSRARQKVRRQLAEGAGTNVRNEG
ncbi:RNA polymerase sigma-70 factor, ECF subfamily [Micromonospora viridifaciens]|uniref:RNA polymerase sigma-70 factor, ECF subfamily n=1 Tax=Micromonospora viridifaciens TaxID=1881 RepID=A0A1C4U6A8_MICVI|nr:RNA polymerase sigma-70 factor, ECF subfamily [Micromonospora viridifaciens]